MRLTQIDHVALTCTSLDATRQWYEEVLGFKRVFADVWEVFPVFLKLGNTYLALFPLRGEPQPKPAQPGFDHLAFNAATQADYEQARSELEQRGINLDFMEHGVARSMYFTDPDGRKVEITTYDVADERNKGGAA